MCSHENFLQLRTQGMTSKAHCLHYMMTVEEVTETCAMVSDLASVLELNTTAIVEAFVLFRLV